MVTKTKNAATQQCAAVQCARIDKTIWPSNVRAWVWLVNSASTSPISTSLTVKPPLPLTGESRTCMTLLWPRRNARHWCACLPQTGRVPSTNIDS